MRLLSTPHARERLSSGGVRQHGLEWFDRDGLGQVLDPLRRNHKLALARWRPVALAPSTITGTTFGGQTAETYRVILA